MADVKSTTIVPIAFYCFVLGGYLLYLALNGIFSNSTIFSSNDFTLWLPALSLTILASGLIVIGMGILNVNLLSWRILFFSLAIGVSSMASLIIVVLIFLMIDPKFLDPYFKFIETTSAWWFSFLGIFLSGIIVLYYLTHEEVVANFGAMDNDLISPF